jgi:hypothetical protein
MLHSLLLLLSQHHASRQCPQTQTASNADLMALVATGVQAMAAPQRFDAITLVATD